MPVGVLVLSGSSGRVEHERCRVLEAHGAVARSIRWFGGPGQPPGICEVPLETFTDALDELAGQADRLAVLGVSKGAEAALLVALRDARVRHVVALAPTPVVWANVGPGHDGAVRPQRSSWTWRGEPLPFVRYDDAAQPVGEPPSFLPACTSRACARTPTTWRRPGSPSRTSTPMWSWSRAATTGCGPRSASRARWPRTASARGVVPTW